MEEKDLHVYLIDNSEDMYELESVIDAIKKVGTTKTSVILSTDFLWSVLFKKIYVEIEKPIIDIVTVAAFDNAP